MTAKTPEQGTSASDDDDNTSSHIDVSGDETASGRPVEISAEGVRQGHTGDHLRGILALSVIGSVVALVVLYMVMKS